MPARLSELLHLSLILILVRPGPLHAQGVRGRLVEAESNLPVVGALVALQDSSRKRVSQAVSGFDGRFALRAPAPGDYLLRVMRIGYLPNESLLHLPAGELRTDDIVLTGSPVALPEIAVAGTSVCGNRARGDTLSSALWTQAGTALAITAQTVQSRSFRFQTVLQERQFDRVGTSTTADKTNQLSINSWPVRSPPPDTLLASGFVENIDDLQAGPTWYGPDAEFLLSDPFFSGHCFRTVPPGDADPPDWVGLAFEPASQDRRSDIRGTLWLDRVSAELRRLDFRYTRLPTWARGTEAGGVLQFAPLPGGGWIVQRWSLRVPTPEVDIGSGRATLSGFRESGGYVTTVLGVDGSVLKRYSY